MRIEWDAKKNAENQVKHGVSFEVSARVFNDPNHMLRPDRIDEEGEQRWHAIGMVDAVLLLIIHVYRSSQDEEEIVRIISARKAGKHESRGYFQ